MYHRLGFLIITHNICLFVVDWSSCDEDDGDSGEDGEKSKTKRCVSV